MYWLIAVSSSASRSFSFAMTWSFPFTVFLRALDVARRPRLGSPDYAHRAQGRQAPELTNGILAEATRRSIPWRRGRHTARDHKGNEPADREAHPAGREPSAGRLAERC